jgi:hypothetical protein
MSFFVYLVGSVLLLLFPICLVLFNNSFSPKAKIVGTLASLFFSWLGFIVFFVLMAIQKRAMAR